MNKNIEIRVNIKDLNLNEKQTQQFNNNFEKLGAHINEVKMYGGGLFIFIKFNGKGNMPYEPIKIEIHKSLAFFLFQYEWNNKIKKNNSNGGISIFFEKIKNSNNINQEFQTISKH